MSSSQRHAPEGNAVKTILILGCSLAGLHVAHALLKKRDSKRKVVIVSKTSHFYWNLASVRAIIPGQIEDAAIFKPLATAFSRYPKELWELNIGQATSVDLDRKTAVIKLSGDNIRDTLELSYDQLVIATGARAASPDTPWKGLNSHAETIERLHYTADRVTDARHIVVGGAGSTGVEVAGELGYAYGKTKDIVLLCPDDAILGGDRVAAAATNELKKLNVTIKYGARADDTQTLDDGRTKVFLTTGESIVTDLYLPTTGLVPNTEYIPGMYLSANQNYRNVLVDDQLRVQGAQGAWACGDVVSKPRAGFMITQKQAACVARNIELALDGRPPNVWKGPPDIYACSVGRERGAGRFSSFPLPSIAVWLAKGRTLGVQYAQKYIDGSIA